MRPVQRGISPQAVDYSDYVDAKPDLVRRLGIYCSYCERRVPANLAVEHIQPKGLKAYETLKGRWTNFLLGCVNCNSCKGSQDVLLTDVFLPDRDNTFASFDYLADGRVAISPLVPAPSLSMAVGLLALVGLDKPISVFLDENGKQVALDRVSQRLEVWGIATEAKSDIEKNPGINALRRQVVETAKAIGFFSIWMTVFSGDTNMRNRFIEAFPGTRGSACFDPLTTLPVCPAPNPDALANGAKH